MQALGSHAPIVPTKILGDPDELDRHLVHSVSAENYNMRHVQGGDTSYDNGYMYSQESDIEMHVSAAGLVIIFSRVTTRTRAFLFLFSFFFSFFFFFILNNIVFSSSRVIWKELLSLSSLQARPGLIMDVVRNPMPIGTMPVIPAVPLPVQLQDLPVLTMEALDINSLPEMERFTVALTKDIYGLGITIAGYVCEKGNVEEKYLATWVKILAFDSSRRMQK